jgi:hypothetical protein
MELIHPKIASSARLYADKRGRPALLYQPLAQIRYLRHLGVQGFMALCQGFVGFHQLHKKLVQEIRQNVKVGRKVVHRHVAENLVVAGHGAYALPVPYAGDQVGPGLKHQIRGSGYLTVQIVQFVALIAELIPPFHQNFDQIPGLIVYLKLEQRGPDKTVGDIRAVMFAYALNEPDSLGILNLHCTSLYFDL